MATSGNIIFLDGSKPIHVTIGVGEEVKAPRELAALEKAGWLVDDNFKIAYKAFLAAKRQGDIDSSTKFEDWVDSVGEIDLKPSRKQVEQMAAVGQLTDEQAERILALMDAEDAEGEASAPPAS